jgi:hypothetical protein
MHAYCSSHPTCQKNAANCKAESTSCAAKLATCPFGRSAATTNIQNAALKRYIIPVHRRGARGSHR